jgi:hypothetical protein
MTGDTGILLATKDETGSTAGRVKACVARKPVSLLRERIFGPAILVISGQRRRMYQYLKPKPEGTILGKRSTPQGIMRAPHDAATMIHGS